MSLCLTFNVYEINNFPELSYFPKLTPDAKKTLKIYITNRYTNF